jgi:hypothetical protein
VIVGLYYQKWGHGDNGYVFLANSHVAFLYTHLVLTCKFMMLLAHHKVKRVKIGLPTFEQGPTSYQI